MSREEVMIRLMVVETKLQNERHETDSNDGRGDDTVTNDN